MPCSSFEEEVAYLSLGSNLGDREALLAQAVRELSNRRIGRIVSQSACFVTEPWGFESAHKFLNLCVGLRTPLEPLALLRDLQQIERDMGRTEKTRNGQYADRLVDIDILLIGARTVDLPDLKIPHPLMARRAFVLAPLSQIAPDRIVPNTGRTVSQLWQILQADESVRGQRMETIGHAMTT